MSSPEIQGQQHDHEHYKAPENGENPFVDLDIEDPANDNTEATPEEVARVEELQETVAEERAEIKDIREQLGLPANDEETAMEHTLDSMGEKLGITEGEQPASLSEPVHAGDIESYERDLEEETQEMREQIVKEYINDTIQYFLQELDGDLSSSNNEQQARQLIALKTAASINTKAAQFIETGENIESLGLSGRLEFVTHDNPQGEQQKNISEFKITFDDGSEQHVDEKDTQEALNVIDPEVMAEIDKEAA